MVGSCQIRTGDQRIKSTAHPELMQKNYNRFFSGAPRLRTYAEIELP